MLLYLIRHAQTIIDPFVDTAKWTLAPGATGSLKKLLPASEMRNIQRIVSSQEFKAIETAKYLSNLAGVKIETYKRLNEVKRRGFVDDYDKIVEKFFNNVHDNVSGWESADVALKRANKEINQILKDDDSSCIALVGHGLIFSLLRSQWLGNSSVDIRDWKSISMPDISIWEKKKEKLCMLQDFGKVSLL